MHHRQRDEGGGKIRICQGKLVRYLRGNFIKIRRERKYQYFGLQCLMLLLL